MQRHGSQRRRGAALMIAMVIVTVVTTMAAAMIWQQWRAVQIEAAERARSQSAWMLAGAIDWARMILREDKPNVDHLGEPWALPLAEARLSTFLAAENTSTEDGPEAFLSGQISDAQARYNLRNLLDANTGLPNPDEVAMLQRLFTAIGAPPSAVTQIAEGLREATPSATPSTTGNTASRPLNPRRIEELTWLGVDLGVVQQIAPFVTLLPERTTVNLNTAPREVLAAVIDGLDPGGAEQLVQVRQRGPFNNRDDVKKVVSLPAVQGTQPDPLSRVGINSKYFEIRGRLRLDDRIQEEVWLIERRSQNDIVPRDRLRVTRRETP